jgi:hypothetical protein
MPEIFTVFVQTQAPKGSFHGRVVEGKYIVEDGVLTLTNRRGIPVSDAEGKSYTQKLNESDNPKQIAGLLTKKFAKARRGDVPASFSRPLDYPRLGKI